MNTVILQSLGNIHNFQASALLEFGEIDNELVSATILVVDEFDAVMVL